MRFSPGDAVRTTRADPPHHSRLPRYARGAVGTVVDTGGLHPLADRRAQGLPTEPEPVYTVRFPAAELFGEGTHFVTVDVWESRLEPASGGSAGDPATQETASPVQPERAVEEEAAR